MILASHREWLDVVKDIPESQLPWNQSTVAYAVEVACRAVEAYDELLEQLNELLQRPPQGADL